jgi:hypothetical protein
LQSNLEKRWTIMNYKKCCKELQQMADKLQKKISITLWLRKPFDKSIMQI